MSLGPPLLLSAGADKLSGVRASVWVPGGEICCAQGIYGLSGAPSEVDVGRNRHKRCARLPDEAAARLTLKRDALIGRDACPLQAWTRRCCGRIGLSPRPDRLSRIGHAAGTTMSVYAYLDRESATDIAALSSVAVSAAPTTTKRLSRRTAWVGSSPGRAGALMGRAG